MTSPLKSYSSQTTLTGLIREAHYLFSSHLRGAEGRVASVVRTLEELEELLRSRFGVIVRGLDVLDIGPGQFLLQMIYFARNNRVVGIDLDVIARGLHPFAYLEMFRVNGTRRTVKTIVRKMIGIDRHLRKEMKRRLNLNVLPKLDVRQMDACRMSFPDKSFDLVHSRSVFHHLPDPDAAISNVGRILRPSGIAYLTFQLFTSENGSLDPRIFTQKRAEVGLWPHLRLSSGTQIFPNAFVNKIRLAEWQKLFDRRMPGAQFFYNRNRRSGVEQDALRLKGDGELGEYSVEELLIDEVVVLWRKPSSGLAAGSRGERLTQDV